MVLWKMRSLSKFHPSLEISHNLLMGLGVSDFVSVSHIYAFLSSHYTFPSRSRILKCQSRRLGDARIYHSPPLALKQISWGKSKLKWVIDTKFLLFKMIFLLCSNIQFVTTHYYFHIIIYELFYFASLNRFLYLNFGVLKVKMRGFRFWVFTVY